MNLEYKFNPFNLLYYIIDSNQKTNNICNIEDLIRDSGIEDKYFDETIKLTKTGDFYDDKWKDDNITINKLHYIRKTFFNVLLNDCIQKLIEYLKIDIKKENITFINLFYKNNKDLKYPFYSYRNYDLERDYTIKDDLYCYVVPYNPLSDIIFNTYSIEIYCNEDMNYHVIVIYNNELYDIKDSYQHTVTIYNKDKFPYISEEGEDYILI